jgi:hypothetical protein
MSRALVVAVVVLLAGCGRKGGKPAGTATDPVTVCERLADVCRLDGNRLGVCAAAPTGAGFTCAAQH